MSTLEKAIELLQEMPERKLEAVYMYIRFVNSQTDNDEINHTKKDINSVMEITHESDNSKSINGLRVLQSFAGTLPDDFNYKRELEEAREEKYGRFN